MAVTDEHGNVVEQLPDYSGLEERLSRIEERFERLLKLLDVKPWALGEI